MIKAISVEELYATAGFETMVAEYAEYAIKRMPRPKYTKENYLALERAGLLTAYADIRNNIVVGFMSIMITRIPHYGCLAGLVESLFVMRAFRASGAGVRFIVTAERHARAYGVPGIFINCPYGRELAKVLERRSYTPVTVSYFRPLDV